MKLKTGTTYWAKKNPSPGAGPGLRRDATCDVAIVGGGITGALVAHQLVKARQKVILVDKRAPGTGSTSASTALLLYETDTSLAELARRHGKKAAIRVYTRGQQAIGQIGQLVRSLGIRCGFRRKNCLYVASDSSGLARLRREYHLRRAAGLPGRLLTRRQLQVHFGLPFPGAIYSPGCAEVDAMSLAQALLKHHVRRKKLRVFGHTEVQGLEVSPDRVILRTTTRRTIRAKWVVVATGYEAAPFLRPGLVRLHSSYVIASQPLRPGQLWKDECLMWETARPYFYLRTTGDHRILMGGEDEPFADPRRRDAKLPAKAKKLLRRFRKIFPKIPFEIKFSWAGTFGESTDGLPYIGALRESPRVLYALGYGGNGITFSQIAATLLSCICQGKEHPEAKLFRFDRGALRPPAREASDGRSIGNRRRAKDQADGMPRPNKTNPA